MKALGGCSSMNAMIYIRGNRADYEAWSDRYGAAGWSFDDVMPYFVRSESNTRLGAPLHGRSGPLHVEDRVYTHALSHAFVHSAVGAGLKPTDDFNGPEQEGAGLYQVTSTVFAKARGMEIAERVRSGMTAINGVITFAGIPGLPFGGVGESGFGRIHGPDGVREFTYPKRSHDNGSSPRSR